MTFSLCIKAWPQLRACYCPLLLNHFVTAAPQAQDHGYPDIYGQQLERRTAVSSTTSSDLSHTSSTASSSSFVTPVLTIITIRATPIRVAKQLQYVTSYSPIMTIVRSWATLYPVSPISPCCRRDRPTIRMRRCFRTVSCRES